MLKKFHIKGMHCNSCATLIEKEFKDEVKNITASYKDEKTEIEFDPEKISEREIKERIEKLGYSAEEIVEEKKIDATKIGEEEDKNKKASELKSNIKKTNPEKKNIGWIFVILSAVVLVFILYKFLGFNLPELKFPSIGEKTSLILLFAAGVLTGFHCIAMCGGFVFSYTTKNALKGHKGFKQHFVYGGAKLASYTIIGGIFGLIGGIFAFSIGLRSWIAILAGIFMIFYALGMFGIKFFRKFQLNPKFLTKAASEAGASAKGYYQAPFVTGILNGLFIACGPLQAMYLYAAGTGSLTSGAMSLFAFGLGTLPVMLGFGIFATTISHKATKKILKISAIIVLILGLIMLNRGLALAGNPYSYDSIKAEIIGVNGISGDVNVVGGAQEINMNVDASGYSPNSFVLKKGIPVKWNINVKQLTSCNSELVANNYGIDLRLKQGLNTVEFTPDKTGTFTFTCGMGMLRGSFIVTETGTASSQEVKAATPSSGSGCSMGTGGGGCGCGG